MGAKLILKFSRVQRRGVLRIILIHWETTTEDSITLEQVILLCEVALNNVRLVVVHDNKKPFVTVFFSENSRFFQFFSAWNE